MYDIALTLLEPETALVQVQAEHDRRHQPPLILLQLQLLRYLALLVSLKYMWDMQSRFTCWTLVTPGNALVCVHVNITGGINRRFSSINWGSSGELNLLFLRPRL